MMDYMNEDEIDHALNRQVPSMERGFEIHTNYGVLALEEDEAKAVQSLVKKLLVKGLVSKRVKRWVEGMARFLGCQVVGHEIAVAGHRAICNEVKNNCN